MAFYEEREIKKRNPDIDYSHEGYLAFVRDYFDIDLQEVGKKDYRALLPSGKLEVISKGSNLQRLPQFKEYCRSMVQMWRDERELI